ncbi:enoyl-CoA hydratase/isomerase family protein [Roseinatronobacter sp. S2]|uniref:enoyl-CoA hydratase/isomerase family protein n=1 Tax=Roseinatronobacter sp. S2 TaxID=3035471 RepID=UPI002410343D|nr:enoyl-CoA hydratase/isomerase family protein [Roseinatronobacter sp. S2]WFE76913.1 enoyl-CoA hydratase/isomerase family protein [Roseinatronobacter sp. S2]
MTAVTLTHDAGIATLTLNRPDRCNALDDSLLAGLHAALDTLGQPRAVVLRAAGRHFSTGGDVARFAQEVAAGNGARYGDAVVGGLNRAILRIAALPCPVIAEVQGALTGGALGLVLATDMIAMNRTAFVQPFYSVVGFAPDGGWTALLPDRIGPARARSILLLNQRLGAQDLAALGLAQAVADDTAPVVAQWLATLDTHLAGSMTATKALLHDQPRLQRALDAERAAFIARLNTDEVRYGMARFLAQLKGS